MNTPAILRLLAALLALGGAAVALAPKPATLALSGADRELLLDGPYAAVRVLVEERAGGPARDISREAVYSVADPKVAVVDAGTLRPRRDGATTLIARWKGQTLKVPVRVRGVAGAKPPRFAADIVPLLTRAGCNMGACHGAAQGKGGFKLSLQGFDPDADYEAITRAAAGRRVSPAQPENSLLLRKPTLAVSHRGGRLFEVGSPAYRMLVDWIGAGMPAPQPTEPTLSGLEIVPATRTLKAGQSQRYRVWARLSDGTRRDVSDETLFSSSDGTVARVTPDGVATVTGKGEAAVLVRYRDLVSTASLISPFGAPRPTGAIDPLLGGSERIDRLIDDKLAVLGLPASPRCSDTDFLRRASLDIVGTLPSPDQVRAFLADPDPDKRTKVVDTLLERPEFVDYWTLQWGDLFRSSRSLLNERGLGALNRWIRQSVATNKPWDQMAREIVLARGSVYEEGPANFYRAAATPETRAEATSQTFLGVRIQCARCHNHPYEKWKQNQYYQMAAFFAQIRTKAGEAPDEMVLYTGTGGNVHHPKTGQAVAPNALDAPPLPAGFTGDRRQALADWLTGPNNPFFAKILVNRVWRHYMGQGLVEPVDDMRVTNPPTNPALLDWLARDFVAHHYDLKQLMRTILLTRAYQREATPVAGNAGDLHYFSHFFFKRLGAEPLLDAVGAATGMPEKFGGYPIGMRAAELPDTTSESYFLDLFGRPARNIVCQCERSDEPNLGQILHFMNGKDINDRLASKDGRIAKLIEAKVPDVKLVEELYLGSLSRFPSEDEQLEAIMDLTLASDKRASAEDILWALLNSKEFLFNH